MPLEATMLILDNSEWMRNGDYTPSRWEAQSDAVNVLFNAKTNSNPENEVGLMTMAGKSPEVLVTLSKDIGKILTALHGSQIAGAANISTGFNIAQLALKHRENKNQRQRIIAFVGSPISDSADNLIKLGKKLKKNNVAIDVINFGEHAENEPKLRSFVDSVDSSENSHLLSIPAGPQLLSDIILSSSILSAEMGSNTGAAGSSGAGQGAGNGGFEFGVDPTMDPELAMALRMSLEEEQARQRASEQAPETASSTLAPVTEDMDAEPSSQQPADLASKGSMVLPGAESINGVGEGATDEHEQEMQARAFALSQQGESHRAGNPDATSDLNNPRGKTEPSEIPTIATSNQDGDEEMTEEEAIAKAIEMSLKKK